MNIFTKKAFAIVVLIGIAGNAWADKGFGKKTKARTNLNITTTTTGVRNAISFNLKSGLSYKGSLLSSRKMVGGTIVNNSLVTYQKGNTTYIIPYKTKITVAEMRQGYSGMKLILRKK
jgi:hypothetical protein